MKAVERFKRLPLALRISAIYLLVWLIFLFDQRTTMLMPALLQLLVFGASFVWIVYWLRRSGRGEDFVLYQSQIVASVGYVFAWHLLMFLLDMVAWDAARAEIARWGTVGLFAIGLVWVIWGVERASNHFERKPSESAAQPIWNPLNLNAWFYAVQWWQIRFTALLRFVFRPSDPSVWSHGPRSRKLDQSLLALSTYSFVFVLLGLLFAQLDGCRELYEMPAGGGEQKQLAQVVKVEKVVRKKFVINPLSAVSFEVPPIDEVQLKLTEITEHAYTVGFGEGTGAGFSEGTFRGKVRLIRLEYSGGDWQQDFGVGGDMNMLMEYGIRTQHQVEKRTESRTIGQLDNFPKGKSPPLVYMTGQQNISLSSSEVKTLRSFMIDNHGMLFCDNGGSRHFHNQFIAMMSRVLPDVRPVPIPLDDVIHRVPYQIPYLPYVAPHGGKEALGWYQDGRWLAYYHPGDIGDAWSDGHAGVKPEIWEACYQLGTNIIFYAHAEYSKWLAAQEK